MQFGRPDGEHVKFLSANTLHLIDQALWMIPFSTATDLEDAAVCADCSLDRRSAFLQSLRDEHALPEARAQLLSLWSAWIAKQERGGMGAAGGGYASPRASTPTEEDVAEVAAAMEAEAAMKAATGGEDYEGGQ